VTMVTTTGMVLETSVPYRYLTRLIAREYFTEFSRRESSRSYIYPYTHTPIPLPFTIIRRRVASAVDIVSCNGPITIYKVTFNTDDFYRVIHLAFHTSQSYNTVQCRG
jgi:hypothetical protein